MLLDGVGVLIFSAGVTICISTFSWASSACLRMLTRVAPAFPTVIGFFVRAFISHEGASDTKEVKPLTTGY